jgi:hypothetical protein
MSARFKGRLDQLALQDRQDRRASLDQKARLERKALLDRRAVRVRLVRLGLQDRLARLARRGRLDP